MYHPSPRCWIPWMTCWSQKKCSGWWLTYIPLWKIWKSNGIIVPNIWENKKRFQTTNQLLFYNSCAVLWGEVFLLRSALAKRCMLGRQENEMRLMDADGIDLSNGMFQTDQEKMAEIKLWGFRWSTWIMCSRWQVHPHPQGSCESSFWFAAVYLKSMEKLSANTNAGFRLASWINHINSPSWNKAVWSRFR